MERIYEPTKKGRRAYKRTALSSEELKIMEFLIGSRSANESTLETVGELWLIRSMKRRGLIKESGE